MPDPALEHLSLSAKNKAVHNMAKFFTREEAEALLATVEPLLLEIQQLGREIAEQEAHLYVVESKLAGNGHKPPANAESRQTQIRDLDSRIRANIDALLDMGIIVKDPSIGLIDFPTLLGGREVYLCWKLGEVGIHWWHEIEGGFAGRQPLD